MKEVYRGDRMKLLRRASCYSDNLLAGWRNGMSEPAGVISVGAPRTDEVFHFPGLTP
jgi:hypothetical protein